MILFFEGYAYKTNLLQKFFSNHPDCYVLLPKQDGYSKLVCVGYFYNKSFDKHIYILPKVFVFKKNPESEVKAFGEIEISSDIEWEVEKSNKRNLILSGEWKEDILYKLPIWLYTALKKYNSKKLATTILEEDTLLEVTSSRKDEKNLSLLDISLAIDEFYKKNENFFVYRYKESHKGLNKINWNKTVKKINPIIQKEIVFYPAYINHIKEIDYEEELMVLFFNTLRHIRLHLLNESMPEIGYELISDNEFIRRMKNGYIKRQLNNIKENYYNENLVKIWNLLYKFHNEIHTSGAGKKIDDYILCRNFDRVFEDMIDELLSDKLEENYKILKDSKAIDHLFLYQSLFNEANNVYYIGDSKYYKPDTLPVGPSRYKQFSYAQSIIQMAVDWYNLDYEGEYKKKNINYIDKNTQGYNVTPNFFITGIVRPEYKQTSYVLKPVIKNDKFEEFHVYQWPNRLFDRDTLYALVYDINFLFVLYSYTNRNITAKKKFKEQAKIKFKENFTTFLDDNYTFYSLKLKNEEDDLLHAIRSCFYELAGKIFMPYVDNDTLIMALDFINFENDSNEAIKVVSEYFNYNKIQLCGS